MVPVFGTYRTHGLQLQWLMKGQGKHTRGNQKREINNFMKRFRPLFFNALTGIVLFAGLAQATTMTFSTTAGATLDGQPLNSSVTFETFDGGILQVTITNLIVNPKSVIQNISGLSWSLDEENALGASITSSSGMERTVAKNGTYSDGATVSTGWALDPLDAMSLALRGLGAGTQGPKHTIIGLPNGSNIYSNANGSIAGNKPHNAFLAGPVVFTLNLPGIDSDTRVKLDSVVFSYGTAAGQNAGAICTFGCEPPTSQTPEPSSWAMMATGAAALAFRFRKRS